jgi:hypothetical protein
MGKNQRVRKISKSEQIKMEQQAIQERRKSRLAPTLKLVRLFTITMILTIVLLYGGAQVDKHLRDIIVRLTDTSSNQNK